MHRKHSLLAVVAVFILMTAIPSQHLWAEDTPVSFNLEDKKPPVSEVEIHQLIGRIIKSNPALVDPDLIYQGDTIYLPMIWDIKGHLKGPRFYVAENWLLEEGRLSPKGCLWKIAETYLEGGLPTQPALSHPILSAIDEPPMPIPPETVTVMDSPDPIWRDDLWFTYMGIAMIIALLWILFYVLDILGIRRRKERGNLDPFSGPPLISGGLSDNPVIAAGQIAAAHDSSFPRDPTRRVKRITRGRVERKSGTTEFIAQVRNGDGWHRARIESETPCYRVFVSHDGDDEVSTEYYLSHCGNPVAEVRSGQFELPNGWVFTPDEDDNGNLVEVENFSEEDTSENKPETQTSKSDDFHYALEINVTEFGIKIEGDTDSYIRSVETTRNPDGGVKTIVKF